MKLAFLGDVVPGGILAFSRSTPALDNKLLTVLKNTDLVVANLEGPFGSSETIVKDKPAIFSNPEDAGRLKELNISVVSLANNHTFDLGLEGFDKTISILNECNILSCGAGRDLEEARKPAIFSQNATKIGFLAYCQYDKSYMGKVQIARDNSPGVAPLEQDLIIDDIKTVRPQCNRLYLLLHWGIEYSWLVTPKCLRLSGLFIENGIDGIIGSHTHRIQPYSISTNKIVFFSLGNFLFPNYLLAPPRTICYPNQTPGNDDDSMPVMKVNKEVKRLSYRIWKSLSRIGIIPLVNTDKSNSHSSVVFSYAHKHKSTLSYMPLPVQLLLRLWLRSLFSVMRTSLYIRLFRRLFPDY